MKINNKIFFSVVLITLIAGFVGYKLGMSSSATLSTNKNIGSTHQATQTSQNNELQFPTFDLPMEYFDGKTVSEGTDSSFTVILDVTPFQSYPTKNITLSPELYSTDPTSFIEPDRVNKTTGSVTKLYDVKKADIDGDGSKETINSYSLTSVNKEGKRLIVAEWSLVIKDNMVIFDASGGDFLKLIPAKNGNGFFIKWNYDYQGDDGYTTTRFIFNGTKFAPVYEQQVKYVRIKT